MRFPWLIMRAALMVPLFEIGIDWCCESRGDQATWTRPAQLWMLHGSRRQEHSEMVTKCQQQGIPLQQAVARNYCQCNQRYVEDKSEFSDHAKSRSAQVSTSRGTERPQVAKDATRS